MVLRARRRTLSALPLVAVTLAPLACGGASAPKTVAPGAPAPAAAAVDFTTPSRLLPDLVGLRGAVGEEGGARRFLVDRMRVIARDDGSLDRAAGLLPSGSVTALRMPSRFGSGFLFSSTSGGVTHVWRASSWLAKLEPIGDVPYVAESIVPGLDRLYVRLASGELRAIDATNGAPMPVSPLPPAAAYGALVFADGWRGVADVDLRGLLATFDAGATWRPLAITERPTSVSLVRGNPTVFVSGGSYTIDERGSVTYRATPAADPSALESLEPAQRPPGPLGRRPLRAAVEDGWPDSPTTAVVARGGALARVSLRDGAVIDIVEDAFPDRQAHCHASRVGAGVGFLCGERDGATAVYGFAPPLTMQPLMRFAKPRFVAPSGNGALVVRGPCTDDPPALSDGRPYCIRSASGATREIRLRGDVGVERVVALSDGRIAVVVPPHAGGGGQLILLSDRVPTLFPLKFPPGTKSSHDLSRGMWLEGFEERDKNTLGGWVEAGGTTIGVRIALDGVVKAGDAREEPGGAILAGRFGFSPGEGGRAAETTDGGMTWDPVDMPERDEASVIATPTRGCSPAGCALGGFIRVGWGKPAHADDLAPAETPRIPIVSTRGVFSLPLTCEVQGSVTPPLPVPPKSAVAAPQLVHMPGRFGPRSPPVAPPPPHGSAALTSWSPFRNTPPPPLTADETGVDNGTTYDLAQMRAYAWGKRGADWTRAARWIVRFDDRFDQAGGIRATAVTASIWPDENAAVEGIGSGASYGTTVWSLSPASDTGAAINPSGRAALAAACRGTICSLFGIVDGQPIQALRDGAGKIATFQRPSSAVRVGETWFFLVPNGSSQEALSLLRVDLGVARTLATFRRPTRSAGPLLVRRAHGGAVGILFGVGAQPPERYGMWYVIPVDPETGELGEPTALVRKDFGGKALTRCASGQDGWLLDNRSDLATPIDFVGGSASSDHVEMRLRLDPGFACVDALAARLDGTVVQGTPASAKSPAAPKPVKIDDATAIPMAATEKSTGRRWAMKCVARPAK